MLNLYFKLKIQTNESSCADFNCMICLSIQLHIIWHTKFMSLSIMCNVIDEKD